jgi:large subunit ribosomal protein L10
MTRAMRLKATEQMVRELTGAAGLVLLDPQKMTAAQAGEFRAEIRASGARVRLLKNAVAVHALKALGHDQLAGRVGGMSAVVWAGDPVPALKALFDYRSRHKVPEVRAGSIDGALTEPAQLEQLSKLPSKKEMMAIFAGTLAAPLASFAALLGTPAGQFVQVLDAVRRQKEQAPG